MTLGTADVPPTPERRIERARHTVELILDTLFRPGDWAARATHSLGLQGRLHTTTTVVQSNRIVRRDSPLRIAFASDFHAGSTTDERLIAAGGKPRRASAEAALQLTPRPRMGERVSYYIMAKLPGKSSDWQRARALALFDPETAPYDPSYYADKLEEWIVRYGTFLGLKPLGDKQGELFGDPEEGP